MEIKQMAERLNSVTVRKKVKRILAVTMAVLMVNPVTGYGVSAHAQETETITDFAELSSEIATQQLAVGAKESDIQLPDTLSVTLSVYGADTAGSTVEELQPKEIPTEEVKPDESTPKEAADDESPADDSSVSGNDAEEPQEDGNSAEDNTATDSQATVVLESGEVPLAASTTVSAISADLDDADTEQTESEKMTSEVRTLTGITWQIDAQSSSSDTFDSKSAGAVFYYNPVLPEGYTLADGVGLPQIQVQIEDSGKWEFSQSQTIDGIEITVKAEKDVFPDGAVLHAKKVTSAEDKEKIQNAVSEEVKSKDTAKTVAELVSFDITITDADGSELQPDTGKGEVKVSFAHLPMVTKDTAPTQELKVFHMDDTLNNALGLDTTVDQKAGTLEAPAEHFSVFSAMLLTSEPEGNIDLSGTNIYANGNAIIVKAGVDACSLIYLDKGAVGTYEEGIDTVVDLNALGISGGDTTDGYDLSKFRIYGGSKGAAVTATNITILSGTIGGFCCGGEGEGAATENTNIIVSGGTCKYNSYGGGTDGAVTGNTNITITGGSIKSIFSGGFQGTVTGNTNITVTGGTIEQNVRGGGGYGAVTGNTNITIIGGTIIGGVYGGGVNGTVTGNTNIKVTGGTITGGVHGGGFSANDTVSGTRNGIVVSAVSDSSSFDNGILKTGDNDYIAKGTVSLPSDFDFTLPAGANLTVQEGAAITNGGNLVIEGTMINNGEFSVTGILNISGTLDNKGTLSLNASSCLTGTDNTLSGEGTFKVFADPASDRIVVPDNLIYNGSNLTETAKSAISIDTTKIGTATILNQEFQAISNSADGWGLSISPAEVKEAGTYTAAFTKDSKTITTTFSITAAVATGSAAIASTDMNNNSKLDSGDMATADLFAVIPAGGTASYQWKKTAGGTTVDIGTDQNTYTLTSGDIKGKIFCEVTFTGNTTGSVSSNKLDIAKEILTGTITITGANTVGSDLTVSLPTNSEITSSDYEIQWYRDNVAITGANAPSYTIAKEDLGKSLKAVITSKEASEGFTGTLTSNVFTIPAIAPDKAAVSASAGNGYITVNWTKPATNGSDITGYSLTVKQGETQIAGSPFAIGADATSYKVEKLTNGTEYTFILSTINGEGSTASDTVTAKPQKPSDGGSSSGGSSSGGSSTSTTTTTPEKKPNQPITATAPVTATAGKNGTASASIPDKTVTDAIAKAQSDATSQGKTANGISLELNVTMPKGATSLTAALTRSSLDSLVSVGVNSLEINGSLVQVSFDKKALSEIQKQSTGNISITIAPKTNLSDAAKKIIGTRRVYDITVGYGSGKSVSSFGGGIATVSIPYTLGKNEAVGGLYAVYVDAKGNATRIAGSAYDANSGCVIFTTTHFSQYGIGYTAPTAKFTDISTHWAKESIDYVVGRGLLSGTSDTAFSPNSAMTRGMLVTALGRLAGVDVKAYTTGSFTDVKLGSTFQPYIEWAYKKGIIQGIGNSQFAPDRAITREEIAVIFANYAKATGYTLSITREAETYADAASIGSTYKDAVKAMQQAGIMMGGNNNNLNPGSSATRAEVAAMLTRYIKLTINPATAQGWAQNDAGQYLYYKDGKALTGTQTIDGVKYFFNTDGMLKTGWVQDGDNWRFYSGKTMLVGWWDLGANGSNKTYYFTKDGLMVSGKWLEIDGKWYYFYTDGSLARSTKIDGYEVDKNGVRKIK